MNDTNLPPLPTLVPVIEVPGNITAIVTLPDSLYMYVGSKSFGINYLSKV